MGKWVRVLSSLVCAGALSLFARPASANEPATADTFQWGGGFRYGFELEVPAINPWGPGLGAELGYTMPNAVYLGGKFDYFFGESEEPRLWELMAEGGYDLGVGRSVVIRPKVDAGFATSTSGNRSRTDVVLSPGAKFLFLTEKFGLSADVRYDMIFVEDTTANALIVGVGVSL
jgi:hypothetical protein